MADGQSLQDIAEKVLAEFKDPETGRSITQVKQVHQLKIDENRVEVTLGLTTYSAPLWQQTKEELESNLRAKLPDSAEVTVVLEEHERPAEKIGELGLAAKTVLAVGSGKGGVGKSTVAAAMAIGLKKAGCKVGLLDADIYGPSLPHMLGTQERPMLVNERIQPVMVDGMPVMSMGFMVPPGEAVIWRGPMLHQALKQFLGDTDWGNLDYLLIDMPPGTGDIALSLSQLLPLSGAIVVCTPQEVALLDAVKAIAMFRKIDVEMVGMIENMSHFICTECGARHEIFSSGGARQRAAELKVPFLGEVPLNMQVRILGDEGKVAQYFDDEITAPYLESICLNLIATLAKRHRDNPPMPSLSVIG